MQVVAKQHTISIVPNQPSTDAADTNRPRYQTLVDYCHERDFAFISLREYKSNFYIKSKRWADLVEKEETQLTQIVNTLWTEEDFKNWRQIMSPKELIIMSNTNIRDLINQCLFFKKNVF